MGDFDSVIFDLDGTLWNSAEAVAASWNVVLERENIGRRVTVEDFYRCMGKTMDEIAKILFPDMPFEEALALENRCSDEENSYISVHGGNLFPQLESTLKSLSEKYRLFIVSNCQCGYIEAFFTISGMGKYFEGHSCWGETHLPKGETNRLLIEKYGLKNPVYVGDTMGDFLSARHAGIPFIHARYGFGEVEAPDFAVDSFEDLLKIL